MASLIYIGAGNGNSVQSQQFFDRLVTPPTAQREAYYSQLIDSLYATGIWNKLDMLLVPAAADFPTGSIDLKGSTCQVTMPLAFGAVFTADRGVTTLGGSKYLDTKFNFSTGTNFTRNSALLFGWNLTTTAIPGYALGTGAAAENHISCFNNNSSNHTLWAINTASEVNSGVIASSAQGFWLANRTGASASALYLNATQIATSSVASIAPTNATLQCNSNGTAQWAAIGAGSSLSSTEITQLYNALQAYLSAVGAV